MNILMPKLQGQLAKKIVIIQFAKSLTISIRSILYTSKT